VDRGRRAVRLTGRLADLAAAFGTSLAVHQAADGRTYRARLGALSAPADLAEVVTGVFGLDERPQAEPRWRPVTPGSATTAITYSPPEVAAAYDFPSGTDGTGQCVGLIELGGGYQAEDLTTYFDGLGIAPPTVVAVGVDGGTNSPSTPSGPDTEVMLDIEVVGSVAPGAQIAVYFAPNTDQGFLDAITTAVHDTTNTPSVVSISWGGPESTWTAQAMTAMEDAFASAATLGVTVTVAAGDGGSSDGVTDGHPHVDFPASAPHALGCGGTSLQLSGGVIVSEVVWNELSAGGGATGGGVSQEFPLPTWQTSAGVPAPPSSAAGTAGTAGTATGGRGVPDVAGDADPDTGYEIRVDGQSVAVGGTSAVAPLWAALVARLNEALGHDVGYLNPVLYQIGLPGGSEPGAFHGITSGTNGSYTAGPGWNPCTGLGSPDGGTLLQALQGTTATSS
jgi:kumamolisin